MFPFSCKRNLSLSIRNGSEYLPEKYQWGKPRLIIWSKRFRCTTHREIVSSAWRGTQFGVGSRPRTWSIFLMATLLAHVLTQWFVHFNGEHFKTPQVFAHNITPKKCLILHNYPIKSFAERNRERPRERRRATEKDRKTEKDRGKKTEKRNEKTRETPRKTESYWKRPR